MYLALMAAIKDVNNVNIVALREFLDPAFNFLLAHRVVNVTFLSYRYYFMT
jgi:hypothetical protein